VVFDSWTTDMYCEAHRHGVRVVFGAFYSVQQLSNATARQEWIQKQLTLVQQTFTDGVNVDFEDPIEAASGDIAFLTLLMAELSKAFHSLPGSQVTFDVAWSPDCIDVRCYNYSGIAEYVDFLFVMAYDMESQIFPPRLCIATSNSPYSRVEKGVDGFLQLGIPPQKLFLGVPWYGYDYECQNTSDPQVQTCAIKAVPFRGAPCSDAAGMEVNFAQIMDMLANNSTTGRLWDPVSRSPYMNYRHSTTSLIHQVWFDDPESLRAKYELATGLGLRGVGMWHVNALDYGSSRAKQQSAEMWAALASFIDGY